MTKSKIISVNQYVSTQIKWHFDHQTFWYYDLQTPLNQTSINLFTKFLFPVKEQTFFGLEVVFTVNSPRYDEHEIHFDSS